MMVASEFQPWFSKVIDKKQNIVGKSFCSSGLCILHGTPCTFTNNHVIPIKKWTNLQFVVILMYVNEVMIAIFYICHFFIEVDCSIEHNVWAFYRVEEMVLHMFYIDSAKSIYVSNKKVCALFYTCI